VAVNRRELELELELARRGQFATETVQPAAFDAPAESQRAQKLAGQAAGIDIQKAREFQDVGNTSEQFLEATRSAVTEFDRRKRIAKSGVELTTPLPASSVGIGFSDDTAQAVQTALTNQFSKDNLLEGQKAVVRNGPVSGMLEFQDPQTKQFHLVNPDLMSKAGFAFPVAGDIMGSIGGGILGGGATKSIPGMVGGEALGSAVGTGTGEIMRLAIGRAMGFNKLSTMEILESAGIEAGKAGAITLGTGGAIVSAKSLDNFLRHGGFSRKGALDAGFSEEAADEVVKQIDDILEQGGATQRFDPTTAQRAQSATGADDIPLGSVEATMRTKRDFAQEFFERDAANQEAAREAFDITNQPFLHGPNKPADEARAALESGVTKRVTQAKSIVNANERTLKESLDGLDARLPQATGKDVRPVIEAKRKVAMDAIDEANDNWRSLVDYDEITGNTGVNIPITRGIRDLKTTAKSEIDEAIASATKTRGGVLAGKKSSYDLRDYNIALRDMKASVRNASKNGNVTNIDIGNTKRAIKEVEAARNKGLVEAGRQDVLDALLDAEDQRRKFGDVFERSAVGNILEKDGAGFKIRNQEVFREIINSGSDDMDMLIRVVGDDPQAMNAVREGLVGEYNRQVVRNGVPNMDRHKLFMETNNDMLGKFFNKEEMRTIQGLGRMGEVVTKQGKQLERIIKNAEKTWGRGKLTSLDPEKMVDFVFNNSSVIKLPSGEVRQVAIKKVKWLKASLKDNPAALRSLQSNYAQRLSDNIVKDGVLNPKAIDDVLKNEPVLREFMGNTYVNNIKSIHDGLSLINKKFTKLSGDEWADALKQAVRGTDFAAPLSKRGRRFTAALLFARRANHKVIKNALLNPEKLTDIAELVTHDSISRRTIELASSLGVILPIQDNIEDK